MILQILIKYHLIFIIYIVDPRISVRSHLAISIFVLLIGHANSVGFFLDLYDLVDVAVVEFCIE